MNRATIIRLAAGAEIGSYLPKADGLPGTWVGPDLGLLERFAALVEAEVRKGIEAFKPGFDAVYGNQEELAMQFCMEIAGRKGEPGSNPDPVRLLEMSEALYLAEFNARTQPMRIDDAQSKE